MNSKVRQYPDISFVDTNTESLVNNLIKSYEAITERTLYPADPVRQFIYWVADIIMQERVIINESAKQNVPRYAEGEYLDSLAEIFKDTERIPPQPATTILRFYISAVQPSAQTIAAGTRATVDGEITFATVEAATIAPGDLYVDVAAKCITTETDNGRGSHNRRKGKRIYSGANITACRPFPVLSARRKYHNNKRRSGQRNRRSILQPLARQYGIFFDRGTVRRICLLDKDRKCKNNGRKAVQPRTGRRRYSRIA